MEVVLSQTDLVQQTSKQTEDQYLPIIAVESPASDVANPTMTVISFRSNSQITAEGLEKLRRRGFKGVTRLVIHVRANQVIEILQQRRAEFAVLTKVQVFSSIEVFEAIADLIKDIPTVPTS